MYAFYSILFCCLFAFIPFSRGANISACISDPQIVFQTIDWELPPNSNILTLNASGFTNVTLNGFNPQHNARFVVDITSLDHKVLLESLVEACDVFPTCPFPPGRFSFSRNITLPTLLPFVDLMVKLEYRSENDTLASLGCSSFRVRQHPGLANWIISACGLGLVGLNLLLGILESVKYRKARFLSYLSGEGTTLRLPGGIIIWEYAQFIIATGVLANQSPPWYRQFTTTFKWSFFDWNVGFVNQWATNLANNTNTFSDTSSDTWIGIKSYESVVDAPSGGLLIRVLSTVTFSILVIATLGGLTYMVVYLIKKSRGKFNEIPAKDESAHTILLYIHSATLGLLHRLFHMCYFPLTMVCLYGLMLGGQSLVLMVFASIILSLMVIIPFYLMHLLISTEPRTVLFSNRAIMLRLGPLYNTLDLRKIFFCVFPIFRRFVYAVTLGLIQASGIAQVSICLAIEAIMLSSILLIRPYFSSVINQCTFALATARVGAMMLVLIQLPEIGLSQVERDDVSFGLVVFHLLVLLILLIFTLYNLIQVLLKKDPSRTDDGLGNNNNNNNKAKKNSSGITYKSEPGDFSVESFELEDEEQDSKFFYFPRRHSASKPKKESMLGGPSTAGQQAEEIYNSQQEEAGKMKDYTPGRKPSISVERRKSLANKRFMSGGAAKLQTKQLLRTDTMDVVNLTPLPGGSKPSEVTAAAAGTTAQEKFFVPTPLKEHAEEEGEERFWRP